MADRITMALVKGARQAMNDGEWHTANSLLLLAILGRLTEDVEARQILREFVDEAQLERSFHVCEPHA